MEIERVNRSAGQLADLPLAEAIGPREHGQHGLEVRAKAPGRDARGQRAAGRRAAGGAGQAMEPILIDDRLDPGQFGDLMDHGLGVVAGEPMTTAATGVGLHSNVSRTFSGGTKARWALRCPGWPPRFFPLGGAGGFRFIPIGSDEGGLDELVELSLSRVSRSLTPVQGARARSS